VRRALQLLIVIKLGFLFALEARKDLLHWNTAILFCIGWHLYCLLASEALPRSVRGDQLVGIPCRWLLGIAVSNCLLFLIYLITFRATHPKAGELDFRLLPVGILIQVYPIPISNPLALIWGISLAIVRIPMTLTWSLSLHLLSAKILGALRMPDTHRYKVVRNSRHLSDETGAQPETRRQSLEILLAQTFKVPTQSSELKYR
jgi:hypothetical protein